MFRRDSSGDEASEYSRLSKKKRRKCKWCKKICGKDDTEGEQSDEDDEHKDETTAAPETDTTSSLTKRETDSDYYSTDEESGSFDYQYKKDVTQKAEQPPKRTFTDLEKQRIPDYASMESFREDQPNTSPAIFENFPDGQRNDSYVKKEFKPKPNKQEEIPLLELESSTEEEADKSTSSSDTSYIESESSGKGRRPRRKTIRLKKRSPSSTETTYIETPVTKSPNRSFPTDFETWSDDIVPITKKKESGQIPEGIPTLDLDFDSCECDNPSCNRHPCLCKELKKRVKFHRENETSSRTNSNMSITFLSTTMSEPLETSPTSVTTTMSASVRSSQINGSSPRETINYLYGPEVHSPDIDQNKSSAIKRQRSSREEVTSRTVSDVDARSFKKKVHDYYKKTKYESSDHSQVKVDKQRSKFPKFLNRLLRKVKILFVVFVFTDSRYI